MEGKTPVKIRDRINQLRWTPYVIAAFIATLAIIRATQPAFASTCSLSDGGDVDNWFGSRGQIGISNLDGSSVALWNYDPNPVYGSTSFWTMVTKGSEWAQIGWAADGQDTRNPKKIGVFIQLKDNTGPTLWTGYLEPDGDWVFDQDLSGIANATHPEAQEIYEITTSGGNWVFEYLDQIGDTKTLSRDFDPDVVIVSGEVWEYKTGNKGDHAAGDTSNKIQANDSLRNDNGTWYATALATPQGTPKLGPHGVDESNWDGDGLRVWDTRCSS